MRPIKPDILGVWAAKWILLPVILVCIVGMIIHAGVMDWRCKRLCKEKGYSESRWIAPGRFSLSGEHCICSEKVNEDGTIDTEAKLRINLD